MIRERARITAGLRYRLPSGNVVQVDHLSRGDLAICNYVRKAERFGMLAPGDQVSLRREWMELHAQAVAS